MLRASAAIRESCVWDVCVERMSFRSSFHPRLNGLQQITSVTLRDPNRSREAACLDHPPQGRPGHADHFENLSRSEESHCRLLVVAAAGPHFQLQARGHRAKRALPPQVVEEHGGVLDDASSLRLDAESPSGLRLRRPNAPGPVTPDMKESASLDHAKDLRRLRPPSARRAGRWVEAAYWRGAWPKWTELHAADECALGRHRAGRSSLVESVEDLSSRHQPIPLTPAEWSAVAMRPAPRSCRVAATPNAQA
jgi:hypothetical protein